MSTVKVGRAGALSEAEFTAVSMGDGVRVTGHLVMDGSDLSYAASQFAALAGNWDEPVVPVLFEDAPWLDGFYRVTRADVDGIHPSYWTLSLDLDPVRGFSAPLFEARLLGSKRAGVAAEVSAIAWHAVPHLAEGWQNYDITSSPPSSTFTYAETGGATGGVHVVRDGANTQFNATVGFYLAPASWYLGASRLTVGSRVIVGRDCRNTPTDWEVSNGVVRVMSEAGAGMKVERWDQATTAWVSLGVWSFGHMLSSSFFGFRSPHTLTVLRNSPECVSIRLSCGAKTMPSSGLFRDLVTIDLSLRRGSQAVEVVMSSRSMLQMAVTSPFNLAAGVAGTGGVADGTTGAVMAHGSGGVAASPSRIELASLGQRLVLGVGHVGATITAGMVTDWVSLYAAAMSESVRAVTR